MVVDLAPIAPEKIKTSLVWTIALLLIVCTTVVGVLMQESASLWIVFTFLLVVMFLMLYIRYLPIKKAAKAAPVTSASVAAAAK